MPQLLPSGNWREVIRRKDLGLHTATFPTKQAALRWKAAKLSQLYKAKGVVVVGQTLVKPELAPVARVRAGYQELRRHSSAGHEEAAPSACTVDE
jgi:hypothetical protein